MRWVSTSSLLATLAKPLIYFGTLVGLSFLFTTREMLKLQERAQPQPWRWRWPGPWPWP